MAMLKKAERIYAYIHHFLQVNSAQMSHACAEAIPGSTRGPWPRRKSPARRKRRSQAAEVVGRTNGNPFFLMVALEQ
jgi:hypothetical protein